MENILIYLLIILCIGLIIALAVYMKRYNEERDSHHELANIYFDESKKRLDLEINEMKLNDRISELEKKLTRKGIKWKKRSEKPDIIPGYDPLKEIYKMTDTK